MLRKCGSLIFFLLVIALPSSGKEKAAGEQALATLRCVGEMSGAAEVRWDVDFGLQIYPGRLASDEHEFDGAPVSEMTETALRSFYVLKSIHSEGYDRFIEVELSRSTGEFTSSLFTANVDGWPGRPTTVFQGTRYVHLSVTSAHCSPSTNLF